MGPVNCLAKVSAVREKQARPGMADCALLGECKSGHCFVRGYGSNGTAALLIERLSTDVQKLLVSH